MKNKKIKQILIFIFFCITLIFIDQFTKYCADNMLRISDYEIIPKMFYLQLVHNPGAAFGIMKNQRIIFCIITILFAILLEICYFKIPDKKEFNIMKIDIIIMFAGAVGNLVDRLKNGFVIDFIALDFGSYQFPRFNFADIYVCTSLALLFILVTFHYSDKQIHEMYHNIL